MHDTASVTVNNMAGQKTPQFLAPAVHESSKAHFSMLQHFSDRSTYIVRGQEMGGVTGWEQCYLG